MLDFFGFEILYLICNFIGGSIRWVYGSVYRTIFKKPKFKYKEYLFGIENSKKHFDIHGHQFNNMMITFVFIITILGLLN